MRNSMTPIPQNYKNNVDWILGAYTDAGVTFPNGFQKDAIQNAVGARKTNKWKNWSCDISLVENEHGSFVIVEDSGTVGLTGNNTPAETINQMMANGEVLPPSERLSRFTSMFNSGGNTTGGGLFGAGKSVYSVASQTYTYTEELFAIYDSIMLMSVRWREQFKLFAKEHPKSAKIKSKGTWVKKYYALCFKKKKELHSQVVTDAICTSAFSELM